MLEQSLESVWERQLVLQGSWVTLDKANGRRQDTALRKRNRSGLRPQGWPGVRRERGQAASRFGIDLFSGNTTRAQKGNCPENPIREEVAGPLRDSMNAPLPERIEPLGDLSLQATPVPARCLFFPVGWARLSFGVNLR